jgi:hypothetical protein
MLSWGLYINSWSENSHARSKETNSSWKLSIYTKFIFTNDCPSDITFKQLSSLQVRPDKGFFLWLPQLYCSFRLSYSTSINHSPSCHKPQSPLKLWWSIASSPVFVSTIATVNHLTTACYPQPQQYSVPFISRDYPPLSDRYRNASHFPCKRVLFLFSCPNFDFPVHRPSGCHAQIFIPLSFSGFFSLMNRNPSAWDPIFPGKNKQIPAPVLSRQNSH